MFTPDDRAFIRKILSNPAELTAWLVYADWLDEHDNPLHAEFLRLMARRGLLSHGYRRRIGLAHANSRRQLPA